MQAREKRDANKSREHAAKSRLPAAALIVLSALICTGLYIWWHSFFTASAALKVSGRLEGYETNVGAKIGGRVNFIKYREGAPVKQGELIVRISDDDIQAQLRGAAARLKQAHRQEDQSEAQVKVVESQIEEAKLNWSQSHEDMQGKVYQAQADVAAAQSQLSEAQAQAQQAKADLQLAKIRKDRYGRLVAKGAVTQDQYDQAATTYDTALAAVEARQSSVEAAGRALNAKQGLLTQALATQLNPPIRAAQLKGFQRQLQAAQAQLRAARQAADNARAAEDEIKANIAYLNILSPIEGIVTARAVEPGAVVSPGQTVLSLINLDTVYLRAFVPEKDIGKVRVGQKSRVYLDSAPDKPLEGEVIEIDPVASFTPENIYFKDDRVKQVFGIKIGIYHPAGFCKPGMPADAEIITQ